jgi:DNA-binding NtrC family response regulator
LNVIHLTIPPLREGPDDIAPLVRYLLQTLGATAQETPVLSEEPLAALIAYPWPGNVRELRNIVERLVVRYRGGVISRADLVAAMPGTLPIGNVLDRGLRHPPRRAGAGRTRAHADQRELRSSGNMIATWRPPRFESRLQDLLELAGLANRLAVTPLGSVGSYQ